MTEACALTLRAGDKNIREKLHLHLLETAALAGFTAPTGGVEGERAGAKTPRLGVWGGGKQASDVVIGFNVGHRIGARRAPNGRLIDHNYLVDQVPALDGTACPWCTDSSAAGLV